MFKNSGFDLPLWKKGNENTKVYYDDIHKHGYSPQVSAKMKDLEGFLQLTTK
jgi:hypothetical protein